MLESGATAVPRNGNLERLIAGLDLTPKQAALLRASARNAMEISPEISLDDTFWTPEHGALLLNLPLKVFLRLLKQNPDHFPTPFSTKAATPHLRWERSAWVDRFGQLTPHVETRSIQRAASVALRKKK